MSMSYEEHTARVEHLISLIEYSKTGIAENLARKLDVSRKTVFNDLEFLKGKGYGIIYSHTVGSYLFGKKSKLFFT